MGGVRRHNNSCSIENCNDQRVLIPACAIGGGIVVVVADTISRIVADPIQLPVGAVMAVIGVPTFMFLLVKRR